MDKSEIKDRLSGYLPEIYHDDDPQIAEALRAAKDDPELTAWLDEQIEFDRSVSSQLQSLASSEQVKELLCQEMRNESTKRSPIPKALFAMAALLILSAVIVFNYQESPQEETIVAIQKPTLHDLREELAHYVTQPPELEHFSDNVFELRDWLAARDAPTFDKLPGPVLNYKGMGCKTLDWRGHEVSLICLVNENEQIVHFFTVDKSLIDSENLNQVDELLVFHDRQTGGLLQDDKVLLYIGSMPGVKIPKI